MEDAIEQPIWVIGTGRSGLSPLLDLLAYHPALAWPSQYHDRLVGRPGLAARISRLADLPLLGRALRFRRGAPEHSEAWNLWRDAFPGFVRPSRDLRADDVTPVIRRRFRDVVATICREQHKPRFVAELSGWSRVGFLREIFPDSLFIHIVRDGRAVANSLTNTPYWEGWHGTEKWRWGPLPPELEAAHQRYDRSFLALAGLQWRLLVRNIYEQTQRLPSSHFHLVRYEDLVAAPQRVVTEAARFAGLDVDDRGWRSHVEHVAANRIRDANTQTLRIPSWRTNMSDAQVAMLDALLRDELMLFGYPTTGGG